MVEGENKNLVHHERCHQERSAGSKSSKLLFEPVKTVKDLIPILKSRLPVNANVYNVAKIYVDSPASVPNLKWWTIGPIQGSDTWIIATNHLVDMGQIVCISAPINPTITPEVKVAFQDLPINWKSNHWFCTLQYELAPMIAEIEAIVHGNGIGWYPCSTFYFEPEEATKLELKYESNTTLGPVDPSDAQFFVDSWKFSNDQTLVQVQNDVRGLPSSAVHVDGELASGMLSTQFGVMGMLFTPEKFRGKGYGKLCMQRLVKAQVDLGLVPTSAVEVDNGPSLSFHHKVGMRKSYTCAYIRYHKTNWSK